MESMDSSDLLDMDDTDRGGSAMRRVDASTSRPIERAPARSMAGVLTEVAIRRAVMPALVVLIGLAATSQAHAQFEVRCVDAARGFQIKDPEFDQLGYQAVWQDDPVLSPTGVVLSQGTVRIASIDPATGNINMPGQAIEGSNPYPTDVSRNGPEWGNSRSGPQVFYTAFADKTSENSRVANIVASNGTWSLAPSVFPVGTAFPFASQDARDRTQYVSFAFMETASRNILGSGGNNRPDPIGWAFMDVAAPSKMVDLPPETHFGGRFIAGLAGPLLFPHYDEVLGGELYKRPAYYDIDADLLVQGLITDRKKRTGYIAMRAPELARGAVGPVDDIVLMALTRRGGGSGAVDLEFYKLDRATGDWTMFNKIVSNSTEYIVMESPEGFVFDGRSYVSMTITSLTGAESIVAIASIDPVPGSKSIQRVVSPTKRGVLRQDPETLVVYPTPLNSRVYVYYTEMVNSNRRLLRCETGL